MSSIHIGKKEVSCKDPTSEKVLNAKHRLRGEGLLFHDEDLSVLRHSRTFFTLEFYSQ